jgi:aminocarboxymuconate-semialdehyde decarboxylase
MRIDVHNHFIPEVCFNLPGRDVMPYRPSIVVDSSGQEVMLMDGAQPGPMARKFYDPESRIQDMKSMGVDMQVLAPLPALYYAADADLALGLCREENDRIAEVVESYPERFVGMATVPLQDADRSVKELERAVRELGLRGVQINSNVRGRNLGEPEFWPLYEAAQDLNVPVSIHPLFVAGAERLQRYYLTNLIGNPIDTTIAIASIIFGGVLEKFPDLKFIFAHAGGCIPYIRGRIEHGYHVVPECRNAIPRPPGEYIELMYFDTITHDQQALAYMIETHGSDHVVLGSDYPFFMGDLDPMKWIQAMSLSEAEREGIVWHNAAALFKL